MGNWIGGDRDGNPFVTAETLQLALARQSETVLRFYLTEVHALGAELSISATPRAGDGARCARSPTARPTRASTARTSRTGAR